MVCPVKLGTDEAERCLLTGESEENQKMRGEQILKNACEEGANFETGVCPACVCACVCLICRHA